MATREILLSDSAVAAAAESAVTAYPEECCGFLGGSENGLTVKVEVAWPVENRQQEERTHHYFITPQQYMEGEDLAERSGYKLVGIYHSHPDHPAVPSQFDLEAALPGFVYQILSIRQGATAEHRWWELSPDRSIFSEIVPRALESKQD